MRVLFLWHYYPGYLRQFHAARPGLKALPFAEHRKVLFDDHFAWPAELAGLMREQGFDAEFAVSNAELLQRKWAAENGFAPGKLAGWEREISIEQVRRFRPDVLWLSQQFLWDRPLLETLQHYARRLIAWVGEPWPPPPDLPEMHALITENPATFKEVRKRFRHVLVVKPGFSPSILRDLGSVEKRYEVIFIGQFTGMHRRRTAVTAELLKRGFPVQVRGAVEEECVAGTVEGLRLAMWELCRRKNPRAAREILRRTFVPSEYQKNARIVARVSGEPVYGMEMYRLLAASRIVLNVHADIAGAHAGNMRMFQAAGVGSCLVTEDAENISELFKPGTEALTYCGAEDLFPLLTEGLRDQERLERIGRAGQLRALRDHSLERMLDTIRVLFD